MSEVINHNGKIVADQRPADDIAGQSPLHHADFNSLASQGPQTGGVTIQERPLQGLLNLRCNKADKKQVTAVKKLLGIALPCDPLSSASNDDSVIRWLSPDEWLVSVDGAKAFELETAFQAKMPGHYSLVNVSGGYTILEISGDHAVDVIKKSAPIDVHQSSFPNDKVVSTVFAKSGAIIRRIANDHFELIIRRSFADYLWLWLQDASREYGLVVKS
jgi:sarcosine oxidase subunit gamma